MRTRHPVIVVVAFVAVALVLSSCQPRGASHALVGKPAPPVVTVDPDGNTVDLKEHIGKDVVMLDFWASWCGPCVQAMPEVAAIAEKYKDRGLVFYAVNAGEDPDTVKEFLEHNRLDIPVAMDFDGKIQRSYQASGLPHTIVIGKDGRVQIAHLGYWPGFSDKLSEEVEQLLDGKSLH